MRLQGKLLAAIMPVIVGSLLTLGFVVYEQLRTDTEQKLMQQMDRSLIQTQQQARLFIRTAKANATLFSTSNLIERYVMIEDEAERYDLMQPSLLKLFASYQMAYPEYREIRLLTPDGYEDTRWALFNLIDVTDEEGDSPWFIALQNSDALIHTSVEKSPDDGTITLLVARPMMIKDTNAAPILAPETLRGYLAITASLEFLNRIVSRQSIGNGGYLVALNNAGDVLFHKDPNMIGKRLDKLVAEFRHHPGNEEALTVQYRGNDSLIKGRRVTDDLLLFAVVPETEFADARSQLAYSVGAVTLGAIVVTTILFFMLLRSAVIRPIRRLRHTAIAIGNGQSTQAVGLERDDEIGDLANAFQEMNAKLQSSIEELKASHGKIENLAFRDSLTGLPNRRMIQQIISDNLGDCLAKGDSLAVFFLDLDDFKRVNDSLGHEAGDLLLQQVAERLTSCVRLAEGQGNAQSPDVVNSHVARIGGDEFLIALRGLEPSGQDRIAKRIIAALKAPIALEGAEFIVGTSIGIAEFPEHASDVDHLIKFADTAMYEAKRATKNTYRRFDGAMHAATNFRIEIEADLRKALESGQFSLQYQPQFDTISCRIVGAEALLRWVHPEKGRIPPDVFVPVAEDIGLIGEIGEWVMFEACKQWRTWHDQISEPISVAVNVSQRQFSLSDLSAVVDRALHLNDMPAGALEIELTESCMMEAPDQVVSLLSDFRERGVRVALDDFGTGYSSLSVLTSLPIDTLKIDRSFVTGIEPESQNEKIVSSILMLAKGLDLSIVAEGVESESELSYLRRFNCDYVQGYLLSKPINPDELSALLMAQANKSFKQAS